jgi:hypothetical protein
MSSQLAIRELHAAGRSYQISQREAERRGLPVIVVPDKPERADDPRKRAVSRAGKLWRMAREIRAAKERGVRQGRQLIALKVAYRSGLTLSELMTCSECRERGLSAARHRAFFGIRTGTDLSLPAIGRYFGMDHSSVCYGIRKHRARLAVREVAA